VADDYAVVNKLGTPCLIADKERCEKFLAEYPDAGRLVEWGPPLAILGTRVPDTPIHRASMWLEEFRFGDRREEAGTERFDEDEWERFVQETALVGVTGDNIQEAAIYYGLNNLHMLTGGRLEMVIPNPHGEGHLSLSNIFISLWADAFAHGVATKAGKIGVSNEEKEGMRSAE
jgi:hypothetical protein